MKDLANALEESLTENLSLQEMENLEGGKESEKVTNVAADCKTTNNCNGGNCASGCGS